MHESNRKWFVLLSMCLAFFLAAVDGTVMNLAVVWIQKDFQAPLSTVQWVLSGYFLSFATFIIAAGKLSDHFGHKKVFLIGVSMFLILSIAGALSQNIWQLIVARVLQGFGGALFWPSVNALTLHSFDEKTRGTAMGILTGIGGLAMSIGPPFGGFLIHFMSWRLILWFNVPLCILSIITTYCFVPKDESHERKKVDSLAMMLIVVGLFSLFFALNRGSVVGFDQMEVISSVVISILILLVFIAKECYSRNPLIDFSLLKNSTYTTSVLVRIGSGASFFTILFVLAFYLQHILGLSSVDAGFFYLPMTIMMGLIPPIFGRVQRKVGAYFPMYFGLSLVLFSFLYFLFLNWTKTNFFQMFLPLFFLGLGIGLVLPSNILIALKEVPKKLTGLGVGLLYMCVLLIQTTVVIISATVIKDVGTPTAFNELQTQGISITQTQKEDLEKTLTGLEEAHLFANEFPHREKEVLYAVRYGFGKAFQYILKLSLALVIFVIIVFVFVHLRRLKNSRTNL